MHVMSKAIRGKKLPDIRHDGFQEDCNRNMSGSKSEERKLLRKKQS